MTEFEAQTGTFTELKTEATPIRHEVFVVEQRVPVEIEIDGLDDDCAHVIVRHDGRAIATGRLAADGKLGRVAVLAPWRGKGVGQLVMAALEDQARRLGIERVWCHAQRSAFGFYERLGYRGSGEIFYEADIPHRLMEKRLSPAAPLRRH